ncbi:Lysosomal alpha-mannosidase [Plasmodiophora brassicae]
MRWWVFWWAALAALGTGAPARTLRVHIVPHSHDDAGWLKTVDEYYAGTHNDIDDGAVALTLDTVIEALAENPARKFVECEIAFFHRWWIQQGDKTKEGVRGLVASGQLEFVGGGWVQSDEANVYFQELIDEMALGHQFIADEFGADALPQCAWQIDPFGHTSGAARVFAEMDLKSMFFARISNDDKDRRRKAHQLEFIWKPSTSLPSTAIFASAFPNHYNFRVGFDERDHQDNVQDDTNLDGWNVRAIADRFAEGVRDEALSFDDENVMIKMGDDFTHRNAHRNYRNTEKVMDYINANKDVYGMELFYSTPRLYYESKMKAAPQSSMSVVTTDFVPYADGGDAFWSGYFTSRPGLKRDVRFSNSILQACQQVYALLPQEFEVSPTALSRAVALGQHHDAIAGTSRQRVADDYARRLRLGRQDCMRILNYGSGGPGSHSALNGDYADTKHQCDLDSNPGSPRGVTVYNPLAQEQRFGCAMVRVPICTKSVSAVGSDGRPLDVQVAPNPFRSISGTNRVSVALNRLQPLAFVNFDMILDESSGPRVVIDESASGVVSDDGSPLRIENRFVRVTFESGLLSSIENVAELIAVPVRQRFGYYQSYEGEGQRSGAYIFRTDGPLVEIAERPVLRVFKGDLFQEVHQAFEDHNVTQVIRLYRDRTAIEFEYEIGPISAGREYVTRFSTGLTTNGRFYTDSNGLEMQTRVRNDASIAANYYPVNTIAFIRDEEDAVQLSVVTDRSMGGTSLFEGDLELMLHRRLRCDDGRGVGEALDEDGLIVHGTLVVSLSSVATSSMSYRREALALANPLVAWTRKDTTPVQPRALSLRAPVPDNVHVLTLQRRPDGKVVMRFMHMHERGEAPTPAVVNVNDLIPFHIAHCAELSLSAAKKIESAPDCSSLTLEPMQIRTLLLTIAY